MKFLNQYKNLSKEIYVLFFGRIVTSMGSLIWPIMTLILKNKLGYSATTIATIDMVLAIIQLQLSVILSADLFLCLLSALRYSTSQASLRQLKGRPTMHL